MLDEILHKAGVYRWGVASCAPVDTADSEEYQKWIRGGYHGEMAYLEKYGDVRSDPRLLLEGGKSIIVCAFPYYHPISPRGDWPRFARYALGSDYHEVVRERLTRASAEIVDLWGGETRVCVDTAPLRERYWAVKAGLGFVGRNCQLILPGAGSYFFIGSILTTVQFQPCEPCMLNCGGCGRCVKGCPTGALGSCEGIERPNLDGRKCLSYLTIESRGPLPDGINVGRRVYGCDTCADLCPHNLHPPVTTIPEFVPRQEIVDLTLGDIMDMTQEEFSRIFRHSAVKRAKLSGLQRNARYLSTKIPPE